MWTPNGRIPMKKYHERFEKAQHASNFVIYDRKSGQFLRGLDVNLKTGEMVPVWTEDPSQAMRRETTFEHAQEFGLSREQYAEMMEKARDMGDENITRELAAELVHSGYPVEVMQMTVN